MNSEPRGQIITFYSYKGGTGRTMALANVACILAERQRSNGGKGVLMIDWDLEAPGLHRFFRSKGNKKSMPGSWEDPQDTEYGLIDLFYEIDKRLDTYNGDKISSKLPTRSLDSEELAQIVINDADPPKYILPTNVPGLKLLRAGCFRSKDPNDYSERVNKFNWEALYKKSPHLIRIFAEILTEAYAYVLVDSRTGVTDISGICTMLLPEKLVVVFTPNAQSLRGGLDLIRRATEYRKESADLRPLLVFPLVSRVEANEPDLRHDWRYGNPEHEIIGYQPEFEKLLAQVYEREISEVDLTDYFEEVQIQHIPRYSYGESIAVLAEKTEDRFSLRRSYQTFADRLAWSRLPWESADKQQKSKSPSRRITPSMFKDFILDVLRYGFVIRLPYVALILLFTGGALLVIANDVIDQQRRIEVVQERAKNAQMLVERSLRAAEESQKLAIEATKLAQSTQSSLAACQSKCDKPRSR